MSQSLFACWCHFLSVQFVVQEITVHLQGSLQPPGYTSTIKDAYILKHTVFIFNQLVNSEVVLNYTRQLKSSHTSYKIRIIVTLWHKVCMERSRESHLWCLQGQSERSVSALKFHLFSPYIAYVQECGPIRFRCTVLMVGKMVGGSASQHARQHCSLCTEPYTVPSLTFMWRKGEAVLQKGHAQ